MSIDPAELFAEQAPGHERMFWLDGGGSRAWSGRRSVLGFLAEDDVSLTYDAASAEVTRHRSGRSDVVGDDVFDVLAAELARDAGDAAVSWVGYFGYAARSDLPVTVHPAAEDRAPDAVWMRCRDALLVEHPTGRPDRPAVGVPPVASAARGRRPARSAYPPTDYREAFAEVQRQLRLGNSYEVNLTYRETLESPLDPVSAYLRLRALNPAPYSGFLQHHGTSLLSSSPERFAAIDRHGWVETRPIKGTTPRGATADEDEELARRLVSDPKFRGENLMVVDLLRNDLSLVCRPGTVSVPALMQVESYPSVHQLVSTVRGRLRDGVGTVDALRALFPAGSMTGAPKLRTMQVIESVEASPRGVYAGAFGWISGDGRADLGVVIRSLVAQRTGTGRGAGTGSGTGTSYRYTLGTGGGITVRSDLEEEYAETRWKAERLRAALDAP